MLFSSPIAQRFTAAGDPFDPQDQAVLPASDRAFLRKPSVHQLRMDLPATSRIIWLVPV